MKKKTTLEPKPFPPMQLQALLLPKAEKILLFPLKNCPPMLDMATTLHMADDEINLHACRLASRLGCPEIPMERWTEVATELVHGIRSTLRTALVVVEPSHSLVVFR